MAESLHDADGFPRSDVPLDRILPLRQEFRILQSDHSVVMNTIERALKSGVPLQSSIGDAQSAGIVVSAMIGTTQWCEWAILLQSHRNE